jgi:hypothetical protein
MMTIAEMNLERDHRFVCFLFGRKKCREAIPCLFDGLSKGSELGVCGESGYTTFPPCFYLLQLNHFLKSSVPQARE